MHLVAGHGERQAVARGGAAAVEPGRQSGAGAEAPVSHRAERLGPLDLQDERRLGAGRGQAEVFRATPTNTGRPAWPGKRPGKGREVVLRSTISPVALTCPSRKFIAGEPMNLGDEVGLRRR